MISTSTPSTVNLRSMQGSDGLYKCSICREQFLKYGQLSRHYNKHTRPHHCQTCDQGFARRTDVIRHRNARHQAAYEPFRCEWPGCNDAHFSRKDLLEKHMRREHVEKSTDSSPSTVQDAKRFYHISLTRQKTASQSMSMLATLPINDEIIAGSDSERSRQEEQFHRAARLGDERLLNVLLGTGIDVDSRTKDGETALYLAAKHGHEKIGLLLIARGANCSIPGRKEHDGNSRTVLSLALEKGHTALVESLVGLGEQLSEEALLRSFVAATQSQHEVAVVQMLKRFPNVAINRPFLPRKKRLLHVAAATGNTRIITILLDGGADITLKGSGGKTVIHYLVAESFGSEEALRLLISRGADVTAKDSQGFTPLHRIAYRSGSWAVKSILRAMGYLQLLWQHGSSWEERNKSEETALMVAAQGNYPDLNIIKFMVDQGADVNVRDGGGRTVLMITAGHNNLNVDIVEFMIDHGADVSARDSVGRTALMELCSFSYRPLEAARLLIARGADINARENNGRTALFAAVKHWHELVPINLDLVRLLIDNGADVDVQDTDGQTVLNAAKGGAAYDLIQDYLNDASQASTRGEL